MPCRHTKPAPIDQGGSRERVQGGLSSLSLSLSLSLPPRPSLPFFVSPGFPTPIIHFSPCCRCGATQARVKALEAEIKCSHETLSALIMHINAAEEKVGCGCTAMRTVRTEYPKVDKREG